MKKFYLMIAAMLVCFTVAAQTEMNRLILTEKGGNTVTYNIEDIESITFDYVNDTPDDPNPGKFSVNISTSSVTATSAKVKFTPNKADTEYVARVVTKAELEDYQCYVEGTNTLNPTATLEYLKNNPYINDYVHTGTHTEEVENLLPSHDYVAIAFEYINKVTTIDYVAFSTLSGDIEDKFAVSNITVDYTSASMDITPDSNNPWTYYVMKKATYETCKVPVQNCYYGMYNIFSVDYSYSQFSDYIKAVATTGPAHIDLTGLDADTEYVVCIFYVSLSTNDPTQVYDLYHYPAEFKTLTPDPDAGPTVDVSVDKIEQDATNYYIYVNVKLGANVTEAYDRMLSYDQFGQWFQESIENGGTGWDNMGNLFHTLYSNHSITGYSDQAIELAKSEEGFTYVQSWSKDNHNYYKTINAGGYGICITVFNAQGAKNQDGVIIVNESLENSPYQQN